MPFIKVSLSLTVTSKMRLDQDCSIPEIMILFIGFLHGYLSSVPLLNCNNRFSRSLKSCSGLIATYCGLNFANPFSHRQELLPLNFPSPYSLHRDNSSKLTDEFSCCVHAACRLQGNNCAASHVIGKVGFLHKAISSIIPLNL